MAMLQGHLKGRPDLNGSDLFEVMDTNTSNETGREPEIDSPDDGAANVKTSVDSSAQTAPAVATAASQETIDLEACKKALAEKQELHERLLRKQAELENLRKRFQRDKEEFVQHANADLVRSLLPTLDGFDRALRLRDEKVPAQFYEGVELINRQMLDVLARAGLSPVEAEGQIFDPNLHQAVETVESDEHRDHEVVEELQRGYKLRHRLLRPAIVKVAVKGKAQ